MPGPWKWYAAVAGEWDCYGFESDTREQAIAAIAREEGPFAEIEVCEARFSTAQRYDGADFVPFVAERNKERITLGPRDTDFQEGA